jgi:hypothetical protein
LAPAIAIVHQFSKPTTFANSRGVTVAACNIAAHRALKSFAASLSTRNVIVRVSKIMPKNFKLWLALKPFLLVSKPSCRKSSENSASSATALSLQA